MRALIIEPGASRGALGGCRALHAAGWHVGVGIESPDETLAGASRAAAATHPVPGPGEGIERFVEAVNAAIAAGGYELVFGAGDDSLLALSAHRERIDALVPHAPHEQVLRAVDKLTLTEVASGCGIAVPRTLAIEATPPSGVSYPALVKPRLQTPSGEQAGSGRLGAGIAESPGGAAALTASIREAGGAPLVQELIEGRLLAAAVVVDHEGRIAARSLQLASGTWPPGAGISVRAITLEADRELEARVAALCRELGWFGLAQVQFIAPSDGSEPRLIDFNGRFYGSIALAVGAGANLPAAWAALATGRPLPAERDARPGVRYQRLVGDLRRLRRGHSALRSLASALTVAPRAVHGLWRATDPRPALRLATGRARSSPGGS